MTFKKLTAAATAMLTTIALTACGGDTEADEATATTITETVTETVDYTTTVTEMPDDRPSPTAEAASEPEPSPEPDTSVSFGPGTQLVGSDIQPGTYRNSDSSNLCYWERLSGHSGEMGDLIANGATESQAVVTIAATDAAFSSTDCGTWELVE